MAGTRTMLIWCPDWPVIASGVDGPVAVVHANQVVVCSAEARAYGVRRGLRKRDAQARCPKLTVVAHDPARDARAFEPVIATVERLVAGAAVLRPGVCAVAARGPARYFGGEERAAEHIIEQVAVESGVEALVGIAEGSFAALLAARAGRIIPPGGVPEFLADLPISTLERPELAPLLRRLGIRTLGAFAALPASDVLARFGLDAALVHRLAAGDDDRPLAVRRPPPDLEVEERFDEPIERVDVAAFAAKALAERLHGKLAGHGLACTRLVIEAVTADGQGLQRIWRHEGVLTPTAISDRVRWQLDGWLTHHRLVGGIITLRLVPDGVVRQVSLQPGLWGEAGAERDRAHRSMHRIQGLLGPESVFTAVASGGRDPWTRFRLVPWGDERVPARPAGPWPGHLPAPWPALVRSGEADFLDAEGQPLGVSARLELSGQPARVTVDGSTVEVTQWAGPWPVDERWWDGRVARRLARMQVLLADSRALLLTLVAGQWKLSLEYD